MDDTPKREPEALESAPDKTEAAKSGARPALDDAWFERWRGTADAGLTTDEIMAMTRGRNRKQSLPGGAIPPGRR